MNRNNSSKIPVREDKDSAKPNNEKIEVDRSGDSSSKSVYEIRLNEFVKREEISDFDLRTVIVRCSACDRQVNQNLEKEVKRHRKLNVITCKECYEFYGSSEFSQDESGHNYCTWCGNGGKLIVCDYCPNGFCSACIRRNFGRAEMSEIAKEGWKCYVCDKERLNPKRNFCDLILSFQSSLLEKKQKRATQPINTKNVITENWLQSAFDECDAACKKFSNRMEKLKSIGIDKKKSCKHVVKKMEDVMRNHEAHLKGIIHSINKNYISYVERQQAEAKNNIEIIDIADENSSNSFSDCVSDETYKPPNDASLPDAEDTTKDEKLQAKLKLLQSSSDSDSDKSSVNDVTESVPNTSLKNSIKNSQEPSNNIDTMEIEDTPKKYPENDDRNILEGVDISFSDMSNSDFESDKSNVDKLVKEVESDISEEFDLADDQKLKQEPKVELIHCDHLLKNGETTMVISEDSDMEKKLDELVDNLCKFPINRSISSVQKQNGDQVLQNPPKQLSSKCY